MRALVTGSTGLLGNNLVAALVDSGWDVTAVARSRPKAAAQLGHLPRVTLVEGDLDHVEELATHLAGVDVVFHTAATFREYFGHGDVADLLQRRNVDATVALARLAHAAGVRRFVHTSSSGTIRPRGDGREATEADVHTAHDLDNLYFRSKVLCDEALAELVDETRLDLVTVMPGWMFGPGDAAPTSAGGLVCDVLDGKMPPVALPGRTAIVDARDVARAMVRMAEVADPGERFIVAGRDATLLEVMRILASATGRSAPRATLPWPMALTFAFVVEHVTWLFGIPPLVTVRALRTLNSGHHLSSAHAEARLGVSFRPLEQTLADTVAWFQTHRSRSPAIP